MCFLRLLPQRKFNVFRRFLFIFRFFQVKYLIKNLGQLWLFCFLYLNLRTVLFSTWLSSFHSKISHFYSSSHKIFRGFCNCEIAREPIDRNVCIEASIVLYLMAPCAFATEKERYLLFLLVGCSIDC